MKKILVIEDDSDLRSNLSEMLELSNYSVITAENGKAGIKEALSNSPDLILCDILMPELDGYGVLYMVQRNPKLRSVPFIFLTAKSESEEINRGMSLGADDYITKPFDAVDLLSRIDQRFRKIDVIRRDVSEVAANDKKIKNADEVEKALKALVRDKPVHKYRKKENIFSEGDKPTGIYFLKRGKVKVYKTNNEGKDLIVRIVNEGNFFGYIALLEETYYQASSEAMEPSEISIVQKSELDELLNSYPEVGKTFIKILAKDVLNMEELLIQVAYNPLRKKVANALIAIHDKFRGEQDYSISRENLAAIAGTATESLIRTLADFKNERYIDIRDGGKITILNISKLQAVAT